MSGARTTIKICGLCRAADARAAVAAGADALGVVLAPSKRELTLDEAEPVLAEAPPGVARVAVFVDADPAFVLEAARRLGLAYAQFHGSESPEACAAAPVPVIKALRVGPGFDPTVAEAYRGTVAAILVDTWVSGEPGGSGMTFDWEALDRLPDVAPVIVAGGLTAANVGAAIAALRPAGVDVSSGVEARPREKDEARMRAFCEAVRVADDDDEETDR